MVVSFFHIDYRESHYCKILLDEIFGREKFQNEIIWAYDYGGRSKKKWSAKHDNIFLYTKDPNNYTFNFEYMAPGLVGKEKAERGKLQPIVGGIPSFQQTGKRKQGIQRRSL